jgi:hypothetical protein
MKQSPAAGHLQIPSHENSVRVEDGIKCREAELAVLAGLVAIGYGSLGSLEGTAFWGTYPPFDEQLKLQECFWLVGVSLEPDRT